MNKKINIILASVLCSFNLMAQVDTLTIHKDKVVIDYGRNITHDAREVTGAVSTATSDKLSHKNSINATNQLFGMLPGLQVLQNAGAVWEDGATLYVRGMGTLNSKSPLILVDGFERSLKELSSEEIESVSVLKDAVATSLYGIRGANGVILVKTKRGSLTSPQINFSYEFNMATPKRLPDFVDGYTYASALNEAMKNDGLMPRYSVAELDAFKNQTNPLFYPNVDWVDETLRGASYGDNITFSARGGGKFVSYYDFSFLELWMPVSSSFVIKASSGQNIFPEEIEARLNNLPFVLESLVIERNKKLVALVYADYEALDSLGLNQEENLKTIMNENLKNLNSSVASYEKVSQIQLYPTEFEKTPKRSIKRYLYNSIAED